MLGGADCIGTGNRLARRWATASPLRSFIEDPCVGADAYIGPAAPIFRSCVGQGPRALPVGVVENRFGSSGRPTPTQHLPIELRKGRRPRRPAGISYQVLRRAAGFSLHI